MIKDITAVQTVIKSLKHKEEAGILDDYGKQLLQDLIKQSGGENESTGIAESNAE